MRKKNAPQDFESRMRRLQEIVRQLESGDVPLEESMALYREGMDCSAACRRQLESARNVLTLMQEDQARPLAGAETPQDAVLPAEEE
ncbi:MAG: exodeoxyribonuclease VII small subunit [Desulfovibrionaceae bacterium]|nr:exodeoxyribonuclease VII small subunit [Desulfovibrionaceae bacterium]